eukprot:PITA_34597
MMSWQTLRQLKGKSVQRYTQQFIKRALILGISLDSPETLLKFIGGLHSYMRQTILMFNPTSIDEVSVQATHLEARGKNGSPEVGGPSQPTASKNKEKRKEKWKARKANTAQKSKSSCTHCKKDGHDDEHCWILHPELRPKKFEGKKKKTIAAIQKDLGSNSGDETTVATTSIKGIPYLYDRKVIFYRAENKYLLVRDGIEYFVRTHKLKNNYTLINSGQMKRMINSCKQFLLMVVKEKKPDKANVFEGYNAKHQADLEKVVSELSALENAKIKKQVQELLKKGFIRPSTSPCGSLIVLVRKKDGSWRMCIDYRALNKITIKNRYPLPRIDDLLDQLKEVFYFSKLELHSGYHQVKVAEQDAWKTTFKTK